MTRPNGYNTDDEQRLRDALRHTADQVTPSPDGLERIRARVHRQPWYRRPLVLAAAGATATAGLVVAATLVLSSTSPSDDVADDSSPSVAADTEAINTALPVYYAVDGPNDDFRLTREFHSAGTSQPIAAAIADMIGGAQDPDYTTLWRSQTTVHSADVDGDVIVVDLGDPAITAAATGDAQAAVQQLVYTATAAASTAYGDVDRALPVRILVDGDEPPDQLRKQLGLGNAEMRVDELAIRRLVQIDNPVHGTDTASPVTVDGSAAAFEGTLHWVVRTRNGARVDGGTDTTAECCKFSPFEFRVDLPPGSYEVSVSDTDPSGGEGFGVTTDTKTFRVVRP